MGALTHTSQHNVKFGKRFSPWVDAVSNSSAEEESYERRSGTRSPVTSHRRRMLMKHITWCVLCSGNVPLISWDSQSFCFPSTFFLHRRRQPGLLQVIRVDWRQTPPAALTSQLNLDAVCRKASPSGTVERPYVHLSRDPSFVAHPLCFSLLKVQFSEQTEALR